MNNASTMYVFQPSKDLVQKVLDELFLEWTRGQESVQVGSEKFGDKVNIF